MDSGSQVTTWYQSHFEAHRPQFVGDPVDTSHLIVLKARNGLDIPYVGYIQMDVQVMGVTVRNCGILIEKDPPTGVKVPGLLGMNVLNKVPAFASLIQSHDVSRVKVAGKQPHCVPAQSQYNLNTVSSHINGPALIEALEDHRLPGGIVVPPTLVFSDGTSYRILIVNTNDFDVWLQPGTIVGSICPVEVQSLMNQVTVNVQETSATEVLVNACLTGCPVRHGSDIDTIVSNMVVPTDLPSELMLQIYELVEKHKSVFAISEDDLGHTNTVKHSIVTSQDNPIRQSYRRIPPAQL